MSSYRNIVLIILVFFCVQNISAQELHTKSNKAVKAYIEGKRAYDFVNYSVAEKYLLEASKKDSGFIEAFLLLAELYKDQKHFKASIKAYSRVMEIDSLFFPPAIFSLAESYFLNGNYNKALRYFRSYDKTGYNSPRLETKNKKYLIDCDFALKAIANPVSFSPVSLGDSINTHFDEYWPAISIDDDLLMFTRQISEGARNINGMRFQEDFYFSKRSDSAWGRAISIGSPLNTRANEGALSLSAGGQFMYFTACNRPDGKGGCDIYYSARTDKGWISGMNILSPVNTAAWESQPSVSADGTKLFFVSNRPGGFGGMDIWLTNLDVKGMWSKPVNLGSEINTSGDEMSPFIHFDGKTLYFSSNGRPSMGGFDIFMGKMIADTIWTKVRNLGYPINTQTDEIGLIINSSGQKAYFSSEINTDQGKDLFSFDMPPELRPDPVSYVKGTVRDSKNRRRLRASYELINLSTNEVVLKSTTTSKGEFLICLTAGQDYGLNVEKEKYLFYSESFLLKGAHSVDEPYLKLVDLNPVKVGEKMTLYNVLFEKDSWALKPESRIELMRLKKLLDSNPDIIIEIGGHTDSSGLEDHNLRLSEKRAKAVHDYLVEEGIAISRSTYKGYGESEPVSDNDSAEGMRRNRRTEIRIVDLIRDKTE